MNQKITNTILTQELHALLKELSYKHDVSISSLIRMAVGYVFLTPSEDMKQVLDTAFANMKKEKNQQVYEKSVQDESNFEEQE